MSFLALIFLCVEAALALLLLKREKLLSCRRNIFIAAAAVILAFAVRLAFFNYETADYLDWIRRWIGYFRDGGVWTTLGQELWACNYNVPYLYALAFISQLPGKDLYAVKLLSVLFDVFLAYGILKLVSLFTQSELRRLIAFLGTLWLPTVLLNGACWAQCDSIYAALAVWSLYLALDDRPVGSMIAIALSFSVKLQAIFILPVYLVLLFARKLKLWHLLLFPVTYIVSILPAVFAGRNFVDLLLLYYNNTSSIGEGLNYNSSSLFSLTNFAFLTESAAGTLGIVLAFALCLAVFVWAFIRRRDLNNRVLLGMALIFCIGIPWLLPHMHDRYFFMADVLSFAAAVIVPWQAVGAAMVSLGSLFGYHAYLRGRYALIISNNHPMALGGLCMLLGFLYSLWFTADGFPRRQKAE